MKSILILLFLFCFVPLSFSQNKHPFVNLEEVKDGKRVELYAVNTDTISYDVFLKVMTEDFRRTSLRPIIKTIAPNTKIKLITLIKLSSKEGKYTPLFIVNESSKVLNIRKDYENFDFKVDKAFKNKNIFFYYKDRCNICTSLKNELQRSGITFEEANISHNIKVMLKLINISNDQNIKDNTPVLQIGDSIYSKINSVKRLQEILDSQF